MKAINIGTRYEIYNDTLKTYDKLPAQVYTVCFAEMTGFYLEKHSDIEVTEKVYGVHEEKVDKVLNTFAVFERNLGVILSGNKGIGKSLFAKMLAIRAIKAGLPVLIVDRFIPGIAAYLESVDQEVMVLFDEFDKTFGEISTGKNEAKPQAGLLTLFDGIAQGKKLFVVTCNQLASLNDYLVNRPGRFHYHFRFEYPTDGEIREYMNDKLRPEFRSEIDKVVAFSNRVELNYDCLRAIAFELNSGESFEEAIRDLNILNLYDEQYNITLYLANGQQYFEKNEYLDLFDRDNPAEVWVHNESCTSALRIMFDKKSCIYDVNMKAIRVDGEAIQTFWEKPNRHMGDEWKPLYATITKVKGRNYHYLAA